MRDVRYMLLSISARSYTRLHYVALYNYEQILISEHIQRKDFSIFLVNGKDFCKLFVHMKDF